MSNILKSCMLCPRNCKVNRYEELGYCKAPGKLKLALASLHNWEEPCISGDFGSGTIFFSNCNMGCVYCQNYKISSGYGKMITVKRFAQICIELQNKNAHNINLVTPTPYVPLIIKGIREAKRLGLHIPIVYNTSSYENVETIKMLDQTVDIYLADLKYYEDKYAVKYSNTSNYFEYATKAIEEMYNQVGTPIIENGLMKKGIIVRVLLLPGLLEDAKKIIKYLYDKYRDDIFISIMNQYTPVRKLKFEELNNKVSEESYNELINYACDLGITNAFIQEGETQLESFIPNFNKQGI
ncbi:MAG: radical SAM protein [Bacilli bacterium]